MDDSVVAAEVVDGAEVVVVVIDVVVDEAVEDEVVVEIVDFSTDDSIVRARSVTATVSSSPVLLYFSMKIH